MVMLVQRTFLLAVLTALLFCFNLQSNADSAVDLSWAFGNSSDLQGWADASAAEMQVTVTLTGGEMQGIITGLAPNVASPLMSVTVTLRHYVVIRMAYNGKNSLGELLLSFGPLTASSVDYSSYRKFTWSDYSTPLALSGSPPSSGSIADTTDSNPSTFYESISSAGVFIVYDLADYRWVTAFKITPLAGPNSPRRCILQRSLSFSDRGPYSTVASFTLNATATGVIADQRITGISGHARYWKLFIIDNFGGTGVGIRDIAFAGYGDSVDVVPFALNNLGDYQTYYLPIGSKNITSPVVRMRLDFFQATLASSNLIGLGSFQVDFVTIARAPEVYKVSGCLDLHYTNSSLEQPQYFVNSVVDVINGNLPLRYYSMNNSYYNSSYMTTYNCPLIGGINITIVGINFGDSAKVLIGSNECPVVFRNSTAVGATVTDTIICTLPTASPSLWLPPILSTSSNSSSPSSPPSVSSLSTVRVQNGVLPGLFYEYPGLQYAVTPLSPAPPNITNVGACKVDLYWTPPGTVLESLIITGYQITWRKGNSSTLSLAGGIIGGSITVGNITTTSIRGLRPGTQYSFRIAAMSEGVVPSNRAALPTDLYGRRDASVNASISAFSEYSEFVTTLGHDFLYPSFNAKQTLNHSTTGVPIASYAPPTIGPTGQYGGEGQYGLALVGTANVQNCNTSSTCCDGYNTAVGVSSCGPMSLVSAALLSRQFDGNLVVDNTIDKQVPSNEYYPDSGLPSSEIFTLEAFQTLSGVAPVGAGCGPAVRLTSSAAREAGAMWYARKVNVAEGFDTTFSFEISNPSLECDVMDDVHTFCRSRGSDGLAFVLHDSSSGLYALGEEGSGLGYSGIDNAISIEFDTYMNYENLDPFENHISVLTQGYRYNITSNHTRALASTTRTADITDGPHTVRVRYDPNFDPTVGTLEAFTISGYTSWFIEGDWGAGFGLLYVYIDDLYSPVIITPLNLGATLNLDNGRAIVGFTAATGDSHYQVHDIHDWHWTSLFLDALYTPPLVVNGEGGHECLDASACVHPVDYDHYLRSQVLIGQYDDGVKGW